MLNSLSLRGLYPIPHVLGREAIEDILTAEPAFAGNPDAEVEVLEAVYMVGIRVEGTLYALIPRASPPGPVHVHAFRGTIELDDRPGLRCAVDDFFMVYGIGIATKEKAAAQVAQHCHMRIFHGSDDPLGHLVLGQVERCVDRSDYIVELGEDSVVKIEGSIAENVNLVTRIEVKVIEGAVERPDGFQLAKESFFVEAVGLEG